MPGAAVAPNPKVGLDEALGAADVNGKVEPDVNPKTVDGAVEADEVALDPNAKAPVEADDEVPFNPKIGEPVVEVPIDPKGEVPAADPVISPKVEAAPVGLDVDPADPNWNIPVEAADKVVLVDPKVLGAEVDDVLLPVAADEVVLPVLEKDVLLPAVVEDVLPPKEKPTTDGALNVDPPKTGTVEPNKLEELATEEATLLDPNKDAEGERLATDDEANNELLEAEEDAANVPN